MNARPQPDKSGSDHEHVDRISTTTTIVVIAVIAVVLHAIQLIILPFVIAGLVAYLTTPALDWLNVRTRLPRAPFAVLAFLIFLGLASGAAMFGAAPLAHEFAPLVTDLRGTVETLVAEATRGGSIDLFGQSMNAGQIADKVVEAVRDILEQPDKLAVVGGVAFLGIFGFSLTLVLLFYLLLSGRQILGGVLLLVPPRQRPLIEHIVLQIDPVLKRYFLGVIVVVIYASIAAYIGLGVILGIRHAVLLALLTGILEMIPMIGPGMSAIIAGLVAIRYATGIAPIIAYAIYATVLRLSIDQVVGPLALGAAARISPVLIIFCFLAGGATFGIAGVILAVPVALVTKTTLAILYDETQVSVPKTR